MLDEIKLLDAEEVGQHLGITTDRVYALARSGRLPAVRIGRWVRFAPRTLREFVERGGVSLLDAPHRAEGAA